MLQGRLSAGGTLGGALQEDAGLSGALTSGGATYPTYDGPTEFAPSASAQTAETAGRVLLGDITIDAARLEMASRTVSAAGTLSITPSSGYYGIGEADVTVPAGKVVMRQPALVNATGEVRSRADVTAGYVATGGSYFGSALLLDKQAAATITPSETAQTAVAQYRWTTGEVDVAAIPSDYVGSAVERRDSSDLIATGPTVSAPAGYYAENAGKTIGSGSATMPATSITANPSISVGSDGKITATVSASQSVTPTVSAGYIAAGTAGTVSVSGSATEQLETQAAKTVTPTTSAQTAVAAGRYTTGAVTVAAMPSGTEGTPTATKGTVSNHSISVTPSVTNTAGYIAGGTKTGTAVSVSASELVSGTKSITASGTHDVTEYENASVAAGSATMPASASGSGTIVGALNNTMNVQGTVTATPQVSAGYVSAGTSGSTSVSLQTSVTTLSTATWTPTTSDQTIPAGRYTIGTQTIKGDANLLAGNIAEGVSLFGITGTCPTFGPLSWLGQEAELVQTYAKETTALSDTSYNGWTPSTTAKTIKSGASLTAVAIDLEQYDYILRWQFFCEPVYNGSETNTARMVKTAQEMYQAIIRRPNSLANIAALNDAGNACQTINTPSLMEYWNNNSAHTYTWSASYGIYAAATAATFASSTALQTNLTPKRPSISARCSTTYFSTGNAGKVTQASTYLYTQGWLYRIRKGKSLGYNQYRNVCGLFNDGL